MALYDAILFVVDIEKIKLARTVHESAHETGKQAAHDGLAKWIEEKEEAWAFRNSEIENVAAVYPHRRDGTVTCAPGRKIFARNADQGRIEFDSCDAPEGILRGKQHRTAHACPDVDEGKVLELRNGFGPLPALKERMKDRRRYAEICGGVAIVWVTGFEESPGDEAAGLNSVGKIERVERESFLLGEARKPISSCPMDQVSFCRSHN